MIRTLPAATPVTTPELLTVAKDVLLLLHVPPEVGWLNVAVVPIHTVDGPEILGFATTDVVYEAKQVGLIVYLIRTGPPDTPVTTPVEETVANAVALLLHVPPVAPV